MTVTELEIIHRPNDVLPFPPAFPPESAAEIKPIPRLLLACPNIAGLPVAQHGKADSFLHTMQEALAESRIDGFNEAKLALVCHFKKQGEPITQWNPLILTLNHPEVLKHKDLGAINLEMVHLRVLGDETVSLAGTNLQSGKFLCANLSRVVLTEADLSGADLRFVDLSEAQLQRATLVEANLSQSKLSFADFTDSNLYCAKLNGAVAKQARLSNANMRKADLRSVDFFQAELVGTRLQQADLREANLFTANLTDAKLRQVDLRQANLGFCQLRDTRLQQARLSGANLNNADLTLADLHECCLHGALLSRAVMVQTNLTACDLTGVDLSDCCELEQAKLESAVYNKRTLFPRGFKIRKYDMVLRPCSGLDKLSQILSSVLG